MHQTTSTNNRHDVLDHTSCPPKRFATLLGRFIRYSALTLLVLSVLLPTLSHAHSDRERKNTTQVRGIVQGLVVSAQANKGRMPGLDSKGFIRPNERESTGLSGHGATVEARYWTLLNNNVFSGVYAISPAETKTAWTTGKVTADNYSYALLNIHSNPELPKENKTRPDQKSRAREWRDSINTQAILIADRARITDGQIGDNYDGIYSIHSTEEQTGWIGAIGRGDGSAMYVLTDRTSSKYGAGANISHDRLFAMEQDPAPNSDELDHPDSVWDDTANALLGYRSVGYDDPDIASD